MPLEQVSFFYVTCDVCGEKSPQYQDFEATIEAAKCNGFQSLPIIGKGTFWRCERCRLRAVGPPENLGR